MGARNSFGFGLLAPLPSLAAGTAAPASPLDASQVIETGVGLLAVLALIVALAWLARRFGRVPMNGAGRVQVLGGVSLGTRERAVLLEVDGTRLLVGVAPGQVRTLHVATAAPDESAQPFADTLRQQAGSGP